jgi:nickel/cobalt transporter (NicO) family protein
MKDFATLLQQGNSWLFLPSAVLLGALHGLEPGHSKTMMAAFIIAVRGTLAQAVLLGLSATLSHTAIVWLVGLGGIYFGRRFDIETSEPYFQVASALAIIAVAMWMMLRTWRASRRETDAQGHLHSHDHAHDHDHGHAHGHQSHGHDAKDAQAPQGRDILTPASTLRLRLEAAGPACHFVLEAEEGALPGPDAANVVTERSDGSSEIFGFRRDGERLVSAQAVPQPHEFIARLHLQTSGGEQDFDVEFVAPRHRHAVADYGRLDVSAPGYQDPHELAHANDIRRRFANSHVSTGQIIAFGLTAGLLPCPAAITVLLLCLQLKQFLLGATLVFGFSIGLACTMVASGAVAALGVRHLSRRFGSAFATLARRAPYFSGALILFVGLYLGYAGLRALT